MSQEQKILIALQKNPNGLHPTYFIVDLHIYQYNARIFSIREQFGCIHKNNDICFATEHIINKTMPDGTTKFYYRKTEDVSKKAIEELMPKKPVKNYQQDTLI